jgi:hypothetical protein
VELALSRAARIPWDRHADLDPDDGDSCIVAEVLHAMDMTDTGKVLVSHDIKPIAFAANYNVETLHVSDDWLRHIEPGPADKEVQRLKGKLAEYQANEPVFDIRIEVDGEPISVVRIEDLTEAERDRIERKILADNPPQDQNGGRSFGLTFPNYDHSYEDRYTAYLKSIPTSMNDYAQRLERTFNQARFKVKVVNIGKMQAENLLVEVTVSSGWLHDRYVWISPGGPIPPTPSSTIFPHIPTLQSMIPRPPVGRHEFSFKDAPDWDSRFSVTCEDFRHGQDWTYEAIVGVDPRADETTISVSVTASNFRGKVQKDKLIDKKVEAVHVSKLIDLASLQIRVPTPIDGLIQHGDYKAIDLKAFAIDEED